MGAIAIRPGTPDDLGFVIETFDQSFAGTEFGAEVLRTSSREGVQAFRTNLHALWVAVLQHHAVTVACVADDPTTIVGYVVHRPGVVAWLYVRAPSRQAGVASALLRHCGFGKSEPVTVIFGRVSTMTAWRRRGWQLRNNPFLALACVQ